MVARDLPPSTTSNTAAAIWYPDKAYPEDKVLRWGQYTLEKYYQLAKIPESGISTTVLIELCQDFSSSKPWWKDAVRHFRYALKEEIPPGYEFGYAIEVPLIDTSIYMNYLLKQFQLLGGLIESKTISSLSQLESEYHSIVNCTGLGAKEIASDDAVYPIRGQLIKIEALDVKFSFIDQSDRSAPTYIVPRRNDCILGGTAEDDNWSLKVNDRTAKDILSKCQKLEPALKEAKVLKHIVGLRPGRKEIRLELEHLSPQSRVIHNYGHGGAGFTLSWGCAREVLQLARAKTS